MFFSNIEEDGEEKQRERREREVESERDVCCVDRPKLATGEGWVLVGLTDRPGPTTAI